MVAPSSYVAPRAMSTHAETQVCQVHLLEEEDVHVHVNFRDPKEGDGRPMLVTRSTETQTECLAADSKTEATQTEEASVGTFADDAGKASTEPMMPSIAEATPPSPYTALEGNAEETEPVKTATEGALGEMEASGPSFREGGGEVGGCVAAYSSYPEGCEAEAVMSDEFIKDAAGVEAAMEAVERGCVEGGEGGGGADVAERAATMPEVAAEMDADRTNADLLTQTALVTHVEETMLVNDAMAQEALASHVEDTAEAGEEAVREALVAHAGAASQQQDPIACEAAEAEDAKAGEAEAAGREPQRASSELTLSDAPSPDVEGRNKEVPPQQDTEDEQMQAWRLRVQLMMLQEAAASCIPAKMSPRELVRTLGMVMSDRSGFAAQPALQMFFLSAP